METIAEISIGRTAGFESKLFVEINDFYKRPPEIDTLTGRVFAYPILFFFGERRDVIDMNAHRLEGDRLSLVVADWTGARGRKHGCGGEFHLFPYNIALNR
jgi:hypothetical protein